MTIFKVIICLKFLTEVFWLNGIISGLCFKTQKKFFLNNQNRKKIDGTRKARCLYLLKLDWWEHGGLLCYSIFVHVWKTSQIKSENACRDSYPWVVETGWSCRNLVIITLTSVPFRNIHILHNKYELLWLSEETNVTLLVDGWMDGWLFQCPVPMMPPPWI